MDYKQRIVDMVKEINSEMFLKMIYGFVYRTHMEEKA